MAIPGGTPEFVGVELSARFIFDRGTDAVLFVATHAGLKGVDRVGGNSCTISDVHSQYRKCDIRVQLVDPYSADGVEHFDSTLLTTVETSRGDEFVYVELYFVHLAAVHHVLQELFHLSP